MRTHSPGAHCAAVRRSRIFVGLLVTGWASTIGGDAEAATPSLPPGAEETPVRETSSGQGFLFHPSPRIFHAFRFGVGALYDAIDPQVMYGYVVRVPQLTVDARYGLGKAWSLGAHLNTMLATTELLVGGSHAWVVGRWSFEAAASVGVYVGTLNQFAFDALLVAPQYRPELAVGYDFGSIAATLRGSLLLMGPEHVDVGGVSGGLDNANLFVGHSEMLYVENTTRGSGVWYFGIGALTTRSYYALWVLFPDSPALFTYPRVAAGYEF